MDINEIKNILLDVTLRLEECKKYEMKYAELSIHDCIALLLNISELLNNN